MHGGYTKTTCSNPVTYARYMTITSYSIYAYLFVKFSKKVEKVSATGFVGSVTLKGERMVVLVTNNHVFQTLEQAMNASYQFGFLSDSGRWQPEEIKGKDLIVDNKKFFFSHQVRMSL